MQKMPASVSGPDRGLKNPFVGKDRFHMSREAVIVSYARTGLAKAGRGGFNITPPMSMAAHAIKHAVAKSGVEAEAIEDCYLGNNAHGAANIGRQAALLAGLPVTTAGVSINRFC